MSITIQTIQKPSFRIVSTFVGRFRFYLYISNSWICSGFFDQFSLVFLLGQIPCHRNLTEHPTGTRPELSHITQWTFQLHRIKPTRFSRKSYVIFFPVSYSMSHEQFSHLQIEAGRVKLGSQFLILMISIWNFLVTQNHPPQLPGFNYEDCIWPVKGKRFFLMGTNYRDHGDDCGWPFWTLNWYLLQVVQIVDKQRIWIYIFLFHSVFIIFHFCTVESIHPNDLHPTSMLLSSTESHSTGCEGPGKKTSPNFSRIFEALDISFRYCPSKLCGFNVS